MKAVAVTGASGFIGGRAAERLLDTYSVIALGRSPKRPERLHRDIEYRAIDFDSPDSLERGLSGTWGILHCAGKAGAWGRYQEFYEANVALTRRLVQAAKKAGVGRLVNLSSPSIYFDYRDQRGLKETDLPKRFSNAYAQTKYLAERVAHEAGGNGFEVISLRPRGVVGAGDANWMPRIIALRKAGALKQVGDGSVLANFTSIENLLDAIELSFAAASAATGEVYNIHNGRDERFWDVVEMGLRAVHLDGNRRMVSRSVALFLARWNERWNRLLGTKKEPDLLPVKVGVSAYSMTMDLSKARARLNYAPKQSTEQALEEFADWFAAGSVRE